MRQPEIARRLRLSQPKVSRLLKQAHEVGIVRISVRPPSGTNPELERAIEARYGLHQAELVDISRDDDETAVRELGAAAAFHLENTVRSGDVIGVSSWSATLLAMVDAMHPVNGVRDTQVVQILGGGGDPAAEGHATHLVRRMANLLHGEGTFLPAPSSVGSQGVARRPPRGPLRAPGDGPLGRPGRGPRGHRRPAAVRACSRAAATSSPPTSCAPCARPAASGDIGLRFLREDGAPVRLLDDRVIGIELEQLQRVPRAIGVAGGPGKTLAIRAALLGGWINCLITDRFTGQRLAGGGPAGTAASGLEEPPNDAGASPAHAGAVVA